MNNEGYCNLMKLISIAHMEGFYYVPRIDKEILQAVQRGPHLPDRVPQGTDTPGDPEGRRKRA